MLARSSKRATLAQLVFHPKLAFLRNYVLKGGFRDGKSGLVISLVNSYYVFLKFAKLLGLGSVSSDEASILDTITSTLRSHS